MVAAAAAALTTPDGRRLPLQERATRQAEGIVRNIERDLAGDLEAVMGPSSPRASSPKNHSSNTNNRT